LAKATARRNARRAFKTAQRSGPVGPPSAAASNANPAEATKAPLVFPHATLKLTDITPAAGDWPAGGIVGSLAEALEKPGVDGLRKGIRISAWLRPGCTLLRLHLASPLFSPLQPCAQAAAEALLCGRDAAFFRSHAWQLRMVTSSAVVHDAGADLVVSVSNTPLPELGDPPRALQLAVCTAYSAVVMMPLSQPSACALSVRTFPRCCSLPLLPAPPQAVSQLALPGLQLYGGAIMLEALSPEQAARGDRFSDLPSAQGATLLLASPDASLVEELNGLLARADAAPPNHVDVLKLSNALIPSASRRGPGSAAAHEAEALANAAEVAARLRLPLVLGVALDALSKAHHAAVAGDADTSAWLPALKRLLKTRQLLH
jgi:hypothetical protein